MSPRTPITKLADEGDRTRAEQTRALYRNGPVGVISAALVSMFVAFALQNTALTSISSSAVLWSTLVTACAVCHVGLCVLYWRAETADRQWRRWLRLFTLFAFVEGIIWCFGATWLTSPDDFSTALVLLLGWTGVCSAGAIVFGPHPPTYLAFLYPAMLPHLYFAMRYRYPHFELILTLEIAFLVALPLIAWRFSGQLVESLRLRFANLDLAEDLKMQKERAEQANRAKSTFLASASHDLRQPVHALGLFIGALRSRAMDSQARLLVDHIDNSVSAMDELFAALLDISKLDAGTVKPEMQTLALAPLLARLCRDYIDEAVAKDIALRWVDCSLNVQSDPVLLERIIRNLISNAVRYTDTGGVLVGCRRRGASVVLQVLDTGRGVPTDQHSLIFQEFFQIGNAERDRTKGLGLGLAIVKRLTELIDAPLSFRSVVGQGSVFSLILPVSGSAPLMHHIVGQPTDLAPGNKLIVVIDDERAIQRATESLLTAWGYSVVVAGTGVEAGLHLSAKAKRPDLIICDYRLRGSETGAEVIEQIQRQFDHPIPAMLITGDTAADRIAEAQASGFLLLHKPLANGKLRAAIGNLLRQGSGDNSAG